MRFSLQKAHENRPEVFVQVLIYKDLGHGLDPYDPKWISALRGTSIRRDEDDFGRIKNAFQVSGAILAPGSSGEQL